MMSRKNLVSIIIPIYNRENLIGETLNSILGQSYIHWECILVDDGSTDETLEVLKEYGRRDERVKYFQRPTVREKGANACRNYGFQKSNGNYIIWFDSDDLMTWDHIEKKVKAIQSSKADFIVAKTANFKEGVLREPYEYEKRPFGIKAGDFILLKIHWYTYDVLLKREIAEQIDWNENMESWQDYNYFCKMLLKTENGEYLDQVLTHRRLHSESIQKRLTSDPGRFKNELLENRLYTYKDIVKAIEPATEKELIHGLMNLCYELGRFSSMPKNMGEVTAIVRNRLGRKSQIFFRLSLFSVFLFKRGYFLLEKAKGK